MTEGAAPGGAALGGAALGGHPLDLPPGGRAWDEVFWLRAADGTRLRAARWEVERPLGQVLLLTGRTEFLEKASIPAAALCQRGFSVVSVDWRGQGLSDRALLEPLKGHVEDFAQYRQDLAALIEAPAVAEAEGPGLILAHSMGGAIALGALLRREVTCDALILSAPMLGVRVSPLLRPVMAAMVGLARLLGRLDRWPLLPDVSTPYVFSGFAGNVLTHDREMFDWLAASLRRNPALQLGMPTLGWLAAARAEMAWLQGQGALDCPGICLVGSEEHVVGRAAIDHVTNRLRLSVREIPGARHEPLVEAPQTRAQVWAEIDLFLRSQGLHS